jgi:Ethanolamine utilization protein EutJ (predicted chaperonin)
MTEFSIIRPGSEVYMADGTIEGIVLEASISGMYRVKYQVAWWDKAEHKTA